MIRYYCDVCEREVDSERKLLVIVVKERIGNSECTVRRAEICSECAKKIIAFLDRKALISVVFQEGAIENE